MKTYDEMVNSLFERRDEYVRQKKRKRKTLMSAGISAFCLCLVALVGIGIFNSNDRPIASPDESYEQVSENESGTQEEKIQLTLFEASAVDPESDSYGDDELQHVDVILNSNRLYAQIDESEYTKYGIKTALDKSDFGAEIGTITEIASYSDALETEYSEILSTPCSQEPQLAGCDVYYYAPADCEAVIIVKGNDHCSVFMFCGFLEDGHNLAEEMAIFGINSTEDLKKITYKVENATGKTLSSGTVDDSENASKVFEILSSLKAYKVDDPRVGTPDWLNDAYDEYDFSNGIWVKMSLENKTGFAVEWEYMPYLGTGYVINHYFLSESENEILQYIFVK